MLSGLAAPCLRDTLHSAGVLGANDGLVSVASLMLGVGGGTSELHTLVLAGLAGLVGGALSMACGEYISVASQRDSEQADIDKEKAEQAKGPEARAHELQELQEIYEDRGLSPHLARQVHPAYLAGGSSSATVLLSAGELACLTW